MFHLAADEAGIHKKDRKEPAFERRSRARIKLRSNTIDLAQIGVSVFGSMRGPNQWAADKA